MWILLNIKLPICVVAVQYSSSQLSVGKRFPGNWGLVVVTDCLNKEWAAEIKIPSRHIYFIIAKPMEIQSRM